MTTPSKLACALRRRWPALLLLLAGTLGSAAPASAEDPGQRGRPLRSDRQGLLEVDPAYFELSAATGGDFYFWAPGEFAGAGLVLPIQDEPVLLAYGRLDRPQRSFAIPVESGARRLTVFSGAQRKDRAVLFRPDGSIVADGSPGVKLQTFSHMTIASIDAPAPGNWRLEFAGAGMYSVSAHVQPAARERAPQLVEFDFVEMGGRPGHEGWFPIRRELAKGELLTCTAWVSGAAGAVQFAFVSGDEQPISTVYMDSQGDDREHLIGQCLVPNRPFRIVASGRDHAGLPFRRIGSPLRTPR